ncbi:MAG: acylphosphatase [Denitrovibrio sp.]|nr:MAG: acylphosphatase [Denitrovibrio sp.]
MKRLYAVVKGRVQGVGYRASVSRRIVTLASITGYVRNLHDGSVEVLAEGTEDMLEQVLKIINEGSFLSSVDDVDVKYYDVTGEYSDFSVKY